jgi:hypothetical protein
MAIKTARQSRNAERPLFGDANGGSWPLSDIQRNVFATEIRSAKLTNSFSP